MITCFIYTPGGKTVELETEIVSIGASDGRRGIIPGHMPICFPLIASRFTTTVNGVRKHYAAGEGILYFEDDVAKIFVDSFESQEEIDVRRAEEARKRAENRIRAKKPNLDLKRAEVALRKAINRIDVASYRD